jgi:aminoglycoside 3-N-acetyltransferase
VPAAEREFSRDQLVDQLRALGVSAGDVVLVHTSFRALRPVEGGPAALIDALRAATGAAGTLVMPSWTGDGDQPFDPGSTPAAKDLGVVADTFWRLAGVVRSTHCFAFAALGPDAERITQDSLPLPPHIAESPVGRVHQLDGQVLLLGVGHDANTTIHLAELLAGVPYRTPKYCTVRDEQGQAVRIDYEENDHCCQRFAQADAWLRERGVQREGKVGNAAARLIRSRDIVDLVRYHLDRDPLTFLHAQGECEECDETWLSVRPQPQTQESA